MTSPFDFGPDVDREFLWRPGSMFGDPEMSDADREFLERLFSEYDLSEIQVRRLFSFDAYQIWVRIEAQKSCERKAKDVQRVDTTTDRVEIRHDSKSEESSNS